MTKSVNLLPVASFAEKKIEMTPNEDSDVDVAEQSMEREKELVRFQYDGSLEIRFRYRGTELKGDNYDMIAYASLLMMGLFAPRDTKARTVYIQTDIGIFGNMSSYVIQTRGETR